MKCDLHTAMTEAGTSTSATAFLEDSAGSLAAFKGRFIFLYIAFNINQCIFILLFII